jgi:hypothetical protein
MNAASCSWRFDTSVSRIIVIRLNRLFPGAGEFLERCMVRVLSPVMNSQAGGRMRVEPPRLDQRRHEFARGAAPVQRCGDALIREPADVAFGRELGGKVEQEFKVPNCVRSPNAQSFGKVASLGMPRSAAFHTRTPVGRKNSPRPASINTASISVFIVSPSFGDTPEGKRPPGRQGDSGFSIANLGGCLRWARTTDASQSSEPGDGPEEDCGILNGQQVED